LKKLSSGDSDSAAGMFAIEGATQGVKNVVQYKVRQVGARVSSLVESFEDQEEGITKTRESEQFWRQVNWREVGRLKSTR
jgi:hypothetical protein